MKGGTVRSGVAAMTAVASFSGIGGGRRGSQAEEGFNVVEPRGGDRSGVRRQVQERSGCYDGGGVASIAMKGGRFRSGAASVEVKAGSCRTGVAATVEPEASEAGISSGIFQEAGGGRQEAGGGAGCSGHSGVTIVAA